MTGYTNSVMRSNIFKLYISNFLVGLVFWYGIEKLFMQSIGIDAVGIGIVAAAFLAVNVLLDIPSGILADRWSRKGTLALGILGMLVSSIILGFSQGFLTYITGYAIFRGLYVVGTSGTYQALMYDSLHELGRSQEYSKRMGRAYAMFLVGVAIANVASGWIADTFDFRTTFFLTIIPCIINLFVVLSIKEPSFHKSQQTAKPVGQLIEAARVIKGLAFLRSLVIVFALMTVVELYKNDFGQLYLLRYVSQVELIGILWAFGALSWAAGYLIAHRFRARLNWLIIASVAPLLLMSFIDNWIGIVLFMLQHVAMGALFNQVDTRVQEATPSAVRASIFSVLSSIGRITSIPASILIGWIITTYDVYWALRFVTVIAVITLIFWWWQKYIRRTKDVPVIAE